MLDSSTAAVLGFRPHTYWTTVVTLAGEAQAPRIIDRAKIVFATGEERFVYHQAAEIGAAAAEARIVGVRKATQANLARGIARLVKALKNTGLDVRLAVVPAARSKAGQSLADIVKSHALIHAAEGDFYRDVVAAACGGLGLHVSRVAARDLLLEASRSLDVHAVTLEARLKAMGQAAGPPWSEDHRLAALAAWIGIADLSA
jgi:hypothetical protein